MSDPAGWQQTARRVSLPPPAGPAPRRLIVRGDLRSGTGYARALRALLALWPSGWAIRGVDLHPDPNDDQAGFPYPLMADGDLVAAAATAPAGSVVLHHTPPDDFRLIPGLTNIGCFYWETDALPPGRDWPLKIALMDRCFAPSRFIADLLAAAGYAGPVDPLPWPHAFGAEPPPRETAPPDLALRYLATLAPETHTAGLRALRAHARNLFLCVQSLAARKGLPALLAGWREHLRDDPGLDMLVLRLAARHHREADDAEAALRDALAFAGFRPGAPVRIALLTETLPEDALAALYRTADAYVSATYGEGFGGTIAEALQHGCPVIAPRHTGLADLLAPDDPLVVPSERLAVSLMGNLSIYPAAATWHVPRPGALAARLAAFARMSAAARRAAAVRAGAHAAAACAPDLVRARLSAALASAGPAACATAPGWPKTPAEPRPRRRDRAAPAELMAVS